MTNTQKNDLKSFLIKAVIVMVAALVLLYGIMSAIHGTMNPAKWKDKGSAEQQQTAGGDIDGGMIIEPGDEADNGITIKEMSIPRALFSEYGISPLAESAKVLTATVSPEDSEVTDFTWTQAFANPSSSWATGKKVDTYSTLKVTANNPLQCTVTCNQAFGEPIKVSITYNFDSKITSSRTFQYIKRVESVTLNNWESSHFQDSDFILSLTPTYGVGTVEGTLKLNLAWVELSNEAYEYLSNNQYIKYFCNNSKGNNITQSSANGISGKEAPDPDNLENSFDMYDFISGDGVYSKSNRRDHSLDKYLEAGFQLLQKNTTNQIRCCFEYSYTYKAFTATGEGQSEYCSIGRYFSSSLLSVSGVGIGGDGEDAYF